MISFKLPIFQVPINTHVSSGSKHESCSPVLSSVSFAACLSRLTLTGTEFLYTVAYKCRLQPITSTLISPLRARKYSAIRGNSQGKWPTVELPSITFKACLSTGFSNAHLVTSLSPIDGFHTS